MEAEERRASGLWRVKETAAYLNMTAHGLYKMVERRQVPFVRIGRLIFFDPKSLDTWIQENTIKADPALFARFRS